MKFDLQDQGSIHSTRSFTDNGFLKARGLIARTGIQDYYGMEIGRKDQPLKVFKIYRPEDVVFKQEVLDSLLGVDLTNDHPKSDVNSETYKTLTCGVVVSKGVRDSKEPNFIACDLIVKDAQAIANIEAGKVELSAGYSSEIVMEPGTTPTGEAYDGRIASINFNHVAIVDKGRAGRARILDKSGVNMKSLTIGGITVQLADDAQHEAVEKAVNALNQKMNDTATALNDALKRLSDAEKEKAEKDAHIAELEKELADAKLSDDDIKGILNAADKLRTKAKLIAGDDFVCDSITPTDIMVAALMKADSNLNFKDKSSDYIAAYFDARCAAANDASASHKRLANAIKDADPSKKDVKDSDPDPYEVMKQRMADAWKRPEDRKEKDKE